MDVLAQVLKARTRVGVGFELKTVSESHLIFARSCVHSC